MDGGNCSVGRPGLKPPCELITWDGLGLRMSGRALSVMFGKGQVKMLEEK